MTPSLGPHPPGPCRAGAHTARTLMQLVKRLHTSDSEHPKARRTIDSASPISRDWDGLSSRGVNRSVYADEGSGEQRTGEQWLAETGSQCVFALGDFHDRSNERQRYLVDITAAITAGPRAMASTSGTSNPAERDDSHIARCQMPCPRRLGLAGYGATLHPGRRLPSTWTREGALEIKEEPAMKTQIKPVSGGSFRNASARLQRATKLPPHLHGPKPVLVGG
ncbi:hypothetical protein VUR80DRAFT_9838 [Thermomyces stellatus]